MAVNFLPPKARFKPDRTAIVGAIIMLAAAFVTVGIIVLNSDIASEFPYFFLFPWIMLLLVIMIIPSAILYYQGKFNFADPLVFATWAAFFPAFVIGGISLASGFSQPYFLSYIQDAEYNLPYTMVLIMLGFAGLSVGYFLPIGRKIGEFVSRKLPKTTYDPSAATVPSIILLLLGGINSLVALILGVLGFQRAEEISSYDGLIFLTTLYWVVGSFLLWYIIFRRPKFDLGSWLILALLVTTTIGRAIFAGNRGGLFHVFLIALLAYVLAGRQFRLKQTAFAVAILIVCILVGMIYGTTFRHIKGSESRVDIGAYTENVFDTFSQIGRSDNLDTLEFGMLTIAERIDVVSSLAVVVSSYEELAPYEESYGLDNNIWNEMTTFMIPRVIWPDKPVASEPRRYSDLYFNFPDNSFSITPMGDLLRNFGIIGVPLGMLLLGLLLRVIYRSLVEDQPRILWRAALYFMLLTAVSYEAFYAVILPFMVKIGFTAIIGILLVNVAAKMISRAAR